MKNGNAKPRRLRSIEDTIESLTLRRNVPKAGFFVIIILYIIVSVIANRVSRSSSTIMLMDTPAPFSAFTGVFSTLANMCIIFLVVFYKKPGFFISLFMLLLQFPLLISAVVLHHAASSIPGIFTTVFTIISSYIIYINDIRAERFQARLRDQAITDRLTGLPNRFACTELINDLVNRNETFAIVSIDINNFKSINDTMGHKTGNDVLTAIAERWRTAADTGLSGTKDFITRQGGDEFCLIIRNFRSETDIIKTINYYKDILENRLTIDDCDFFINASFGYALCPDDSRSADTLLSYADAAMCEVKRTQMSERILHFSPDQLKMEHALETELKLREALNNDRILFKLQPQFDLSHDLRGFEALARLQDADGSIISPGEFIPVAEKVGLIDKVDAAVFRNSAMFFGDLIKRTGTKATLSINASVRHLMKNDFLDEISDILQKSGMPAEQLEIEITESIMIDSAEKALDCISKIKAMGIKVAIDDFGTGYSSLSYLNKFPADLLKIDKSFIDKMNSSDSSKQYVAAIISIGHIMNFEVISEGVEEQEQLETLRSIGCDFIQGYLWGRPLSPEDAEKVVMDSLK